MEYTLRCKRIWSRRYQHQKSQMKNYSKLNGEVTEVGLQVKNFFFGAEWIRLRLLK